MANSTNLRADAATLQTTAFSANTLSRVTFEGEVALSGLALSVQTQLDQVKRTLMRIAEHCDAADPQLTLINNMLGTLG